MRSATSPFPECNENAAALRACCNKVLSLHLGSARTLQCNKVLSLHLGIARTLHTVVRGSPRAPRASRLLQCKKPTDETFTLQIRLLQCKKNTM